MTLFWIGLSGLIFLLGLRTLAWHLQCWQLREYRFDRMRAWLNTNDGKQFFAPWFFKGVFPRPKFSGRVVLITGFVLLCSLTFYIFIFLTLVWDVFPWFLDTKSSEDNFKDYYLKYGHTLCSERYGVFCSIPDLIALILIERLIWLQVTIAVFLSKFPVWLGQKRVYKKAREIIKNSDSNITRIGITGSYGKSSTKQILVHLLEQTYGQENVLYNPANNNNEVAIARLIINNKKFFAQAPDDKKKKFFVAEMGAYRKGEIATMCHYVQPHQGLVTGLNQQHIELFGSQRIIQEAKFEVAESATDRVFFNADNALTHEIFAEKEISATKIAVSSKSIVENLKSFPDRSEFTIYGENFTLPWPGKFFVENATLCLELVRELGVSPKDLAKHLKTLPPLERAMNLEVLPNGLSVIRDLYSANVDGVMSAINHLKNYTGQRIIIALPLRELGDQAEAIHEQIFKKLKELNVTTYWCKPDFAKLGKKILGNKFIEVKDGNNAPIKAHVRQLEKTDVVLLESKLPKTIEKLFR